MKQIYQYFILILLVISLGACDPWDDHIKTNNEQENESVMSIIASTPELSKFTEILNKTGYATQLKESTIFTVFAPTNEALSTVDMNDLKALRVLVENHLAYTSYPVSGGIFKNSTVEMVNTKKIAVAGLTLNGSTAKSYNITASNGILHVMDKIITMKLNIWEYLQSKDEELYGQIKYIKSLNDSIMDTDKSILIGYNPDGTPKYDVVNKYQNLFLDKYPLNDESASFTFALLNSAALDVLVNKYTPYFRRILEDKTQDNDLVLNEITKDLILVPMKITSNGSYLSVDGVSVLLNSTDIVETYEASNGTVYLFNNVDVKLYENKIKTIIIEGENAVSKWSDDDAWSVRNRAWAQGGKDLMLNGQTQNKVDGADHNYSYRDKLLNKAINAYAEYKTNLNSVGYKMYIKAYDDIVGHYVNLPQGPMLLEQKLFVSLPDSAVLKRETNGNMSNNFKARTVFAISTHAGVNTESQFQRYTTTATNPLVYNLVDPFVSEDEFGDQQTLKSPNYGQATLMIANSPRTATGATSGLLFIDYIKLVPILDPND